MASLFCFADEQCSPLRIIHCRDKSRFVRGTFMNVPYARYFASPVQGEVACECVTEGLSLIQSVGDTSPLHSYILLITFSGGPSGTPVPTNSWTNKVRPYRIRRRHLDCHKAITSLEECLLNVSLPHTQGVQGCNPLVTVIKLRDQFGHFASFVQA